MSAEQQEQAGQPAAAAAAPLHPQEEQEALAAGLPDVHDAEPEGDEGVDYISPAQARGSEQLHVLAW